MNRKERRAYYDLDVKDWTFLFWQRCNSELIRVTVRARTLQEAIKETKKHETKDFKRYIPPFS